MVDDSFFLSLAAPAQRALQAEGIKSLKDIAKQTRNSIAVLHGIGPNALKSIEAALEKADLHFVSLPSSRETPTQPCQLVDQYIASCPTQAQTKLHEIRSIIRQAAPEAQEIISYDMPAYYLNGNLVYFAGFAKHIGFYPTPSAISAFQGELSVYKNAKGSVQFPLDKPLPTDLIRRMVLFRVQETTKKTDRSK